MFQKSWDVFLPEKKNLREGPRPLKALKNQRICQHCDITRYKVISRLISDHLEHSMRQIEGNCDPDLIRGVLGPKNRKFENHEQLKEYI